MAKLRRNPDYGKTLQRGDVNHTKEALLPKGGKERLAVLRMVALKVLAGEGCSKNQILDFYNQQYQQKRATMGIKGQPKKLKVTTMENYMKEDGISMIKTGKTKGGNKTYAVCDIRNFFLKACLNQILGTRSDDSTWGGNLGESRIIQANVDTKKWNMAEARI